LSAEIFGIARIYRIAQVDFWLMIVPRSDAHAA
jgi:hypothetical protein